MKAVNIVWNLDEGDSDYALPKEVELPEKFRNTDCDYDEVADYLFDEYGYRVLSCDIKGNNVQKFYFTFGDTPTQPFCRGHIVVYAQDARAAEATFSAAYPADPETGLLPYAFMYSENDWKDIDVEKYPTMKKCHGVIKLVVELTEE